MKEKGKKYLTEEGALKPYKYLLDK